MQQQHGVLLRSLPRRRSPLTFRLFAAPRPGARGGEPSSRGWSDAIWAQADSVHCSRLYGFQLRSHGIYSDRPHRSHARLPGEAVAPRSILEFVAFLAGLFLIFVQSVDSKKWAKWRPFRRCQRYPF